MRPTPPRPSSWTFFERWLDGMPHVVRSWELPPVELELAVPGEHNRQNAAAALAALELAGVPRAEARGRDRAVHRRRPTLRARRQRGGVTVYDDYGHNPTEIEVTLRTARSLTSGRLIAVYQPHVVERTRQLHAELGAALGLADAAIVTDIIAARDAPREGVTGKLVVDSLPSHVRAGWAPSHDDAAALALAWARPGDLVITFGVGEPWKIARAIVDGLRA